MHICSERLGLLPNPSLTWTDFAETCINTVEQVCLQPEDEYGSPSLDEIALFSHHFSEEYHRAIGEAAEEVAVEVSSPVSLSMQIPRLQICRLGCRWACKPAAYAYVHVVFNDVALRDCQNCRISRPYRDAQDRLLWRDKTCPART